MRTPYPNDLSGYRFGNLVVLRQARPSECSEAQLRSYDQKWYCQCDCGNTKVAARPNLLSGRVTSCGCARTRRIPQPEANTIPDFVPMDPVLHGKLRNIWNGMRQRCYSDCYKSRDRYRDRGIVMCSDWRDNFHAFAKWAVENGYMIGLSIDRIDPDGNYTPENCRFVTMAEQQRNKSNSVNFKFTIEASNGKDRDYVEKNIPQLSKEFGVPESTIRARVKNGKSIIEAIGAPVDRQDYYNGRTRPELAQMVGTSDSAFRTQMSRHGWNVKTTMIYYANKNRKTSLIPWINVNVPEERDSNRRYPVEATVQRNIREEQLPIPEYGPETFPDEDAEIEYIGGLYDEICRGRRINPYDLERFSRTLAEMPFVLSDPNEYRNLPSIGRQQIDRAIEINTECLIAEDLAKAEAELREEMRLQNKRLLGEAWEPCVTWSD